MADDAGPDRDQLADALSSMGGGDGDPPPIKARPSSRPARPDRPDRPNMPSSTGWEPATRESAGGEQPTAADYLGAVSDVDDDMMNAPAPEPEVLSHVSGAPVARPLRDPRRMTMQRTFIPILLTLGTLLLFTGALRFVAGEDSSIGGLSSSLSAAMLVGGAVVLGMGVLNMFYVRAVLAAHAGTSKR